MRIRIVSYEEVSSWILGKFALKMQENLQAMSIESDIGREPDPSADINHHIMNWGFSGKANPVDTLMVTHVESLGKLNILKDQLKTARMGVCMSRETVEKLKAGGIPADRLTYVNPAHDEVIKPRKFVIGITSKTYADGRKKEGELLSIASSISPLYFEFRIMGAGWAGQVAKLRELGFEVAYYEAFDRPVYLELMRTFDYYLYFSWDEGSMGYLDALCAGVRTLVTPQGFHLDAVGGLHHPIRNIGEVATVLNQAAEERARLVHSVGNWTWRNYTLKHVGIWRFLLGQEPALPPPSFDGNVAAEEGAPRVDRARFFLTLAKNHLGFKAREWKEKLSPGGRKGA